MKSLWKELQDLISYNMELKTDNKELKTRIKELIAKNTKNEELHLKYDRDFAIIKTKLGLLNTSENSILEPVKDAPQ